MRLQSLCVLVGVVCIASTIVQADTAFSISQYPGMQWNALGLAVDPVNGHVFIGSNSYGGEDNLYEFAPDGTLLNSTRAAFDVGPSGNLDSMVIGREGHIFAYAAYLDQYPASRYLLEMSQDGQTVYSATIHPSAHAGLTYDPVNDRLFYVDYLSPRKYRVVEVGSTGDIVKCCG